MIKQKLLMLLFAFLISLSCFADGTFFNFYNNNADVSLRVWSGKTLVITVPAPPPSQGPTITPLMISNIQNVCGQNQNCYFAIMDGRKNKLASFSINAKNMTLNQFWANVTTNPPFLLNGTVCYYYYVSPC